MYQPNTPSSQIITNKVLTGKEFNEKYKDKLDTFIKFMNDNNIHHNFKYKIGLNIDTLPFNPSEQCKQGGLYFTSFDYFTDYFIGYGNYFCLVTIPDDALVYEENTRWKANKIIINKRIHIEDYVSTLSHDIIMKLIQQNGQILEYVKEQTPELCIEAVKQDGDALHYVKEQTPEICMEAVKQKGYVLKYVKEQTPEICMEAVKHKGLALQYVKKQTYDICMVAIKQDERALKYVNEHILKIIKQNNYNR